MKTIIISLIYCLTVFYVNAQTEVDSLVKMGIQYHDEGKFDEAVEIYKKALELDKENPLVHYEISFSYMSAGKYEKALEHSSKSLEISEKYYLPSVIIKGSCLDYLGKTDESVKLFEEAIKKYPNEYLLHYNLGYNYFNLHEFEKAKECLLNSIEANPEHASSHLTLAYVMHQLKKKSQCVLGLYYFLFLEPNSERAQTVYVFLMNQLSGNVSRDKDNPKNITINIGKSDDGNEFAAVEMMIAMLEASKNLEENKDKSEMQMFIENTTSLFKVYGELKKKKNTGLWWDFYVPFFYDLARSEHMETFCNYVSLGTKKEALEWLKSNEQKVDEFGKWLKEN